MSYYLHSCTFGEQERYENKQEFGSNLKQYMTLLSNKIIS